MKNITTLILLALLLVVPPIIYSYVTKGYNNFIKLEVVGEKKDNGEDHKISEFSLINQHNEIINNDTMLGNIYVADFFFTTCPSICPIMTKNMHALQEKLSNYPQVKLLSFSVTPEIDTVAQLKRYALTNKVDDTRWNLVTGAKKEIYQLARKSYLVVQEDGNGGPHDMIHTENFVLVDAQRRIRGYYDGTQLSAMEDILRDIGILVAEK